MGTDTGGNGWFVEEGYYIEGFVLSSKQIISLGSGRKEASSSQAYKAEHVSESAIQSDSFKRTKLLQLESV